MGFPYFRPAYLSQYKIYVRGGPRAKESLHKYLEHQMQPPYFPVPFGAMKAQFDFTFGQPKTKQIVGPAEIWSIALNHPNGGYGFKIIEGDNVFVFLPDNELDFAHYPGFSRQVYVDFCQGVILLMHDTQYTDEEYHRMRGWGHTRLSSTIKLGLQAGVERLGLFHHDPERTDEDLDTIASSARAKIAQAGGQIDCFAVREGMEITIQKKR
jgi:phosphoribosyl 1,2-cyclic phosphodiesterase